MVARMSEYIHQSHNGSVLMSPLVCPAQERRVVFDASVDMVLKEVCLDSVKRSAILCLESGPEREHVHFFMQAIPPSRPTKMVQTIKSMTARAVLQSVPAVKKQ